MSILLTKDVRAIVQGITGSIGRVQTKWMLDYGTNLVGGVTPGKGGNEVLGLSVYDDVYQAVEEKGANATVLFVPAPFVLEAVLEAIDAGIKLIVTIPEHVPVHDVLKMKKKAHEAQACLLGPNTPGIISPGTGKLGIMPGNLFKEGRTGIISRSGTLSYEVAGLINDAGFGQSTLVGVGGDSVVGTSIIRLLQAFEADPQTDVVVVIGEIGGRSEEEAAEYIEEMTKPVVAYIAGRTAPPGRRMGHAGAIISKEGQGTVESKVKAFEHAGVPVAYKPSQIPLLIKEQMNSE